MFNFTRDLDVLINGTDYVTQVTEIHIESRYEIATSITPQLEIPYALITLSTAANINPKNIVEIKVSTLSSYRNTTRWPGAITIFKGEIDQVDETITPFGMRLLQLTVFSPIKKLLAGKVDSTTISFAHSPESRARVALAQSNVDNWPPTAPATLVNHAGGGSGAQMPAEVITNTTAGEILQTALDCEAGAITYAVWDSATSDVFWWWPRGSYNSMTPPTGTGDTTHFSTNHATNSNHFCMTEVQVTKETSNHFNAISATLSADSTTYINPTTYAACKNSTSVGLYGVIPYDVSLNFNRPSANPTQHLKAWVDAVNLTRPATRVESVTAIANMRDGYVNGILVDPYWLMSDGLYVTIEKTYPGTSKKSYTLRDVYYCSGQIHDITPTSWYVQYELWKGF
jgi:hypothetical protein